MARAAASTTRSSGKSLLMTRRSRSVPASGAMVMERSPPSAIRYASFAVMASTRSDEGLKVPPSSPMRQVSASRPLWSLMSGPTRPTRWPRAMPRRASSVTVASDTSR